MRKICRCDPAYTWEQGKLHSAQSNGHQVRLMLAFGKTPLAEELFCYGIFPADCGNILIV
jgi:hypothetical protein